MAKIVCVTTSDDALRFVDAFLAALTKRGHEVHLATRLGKRALTLERENGVFVHHVPFTRRMTPLEDAVAGYRLSRVLAEVDPDVVHAHNPKAGLWGMVCARAQGVRHRIYTVHGLPYVTAKGARRQILSGVERLALSLATHVICVSSSVRSELATQFGSPEKLTVIGPGSAQGIDTIAFSRADWVGAGSRFRQSRGIPPGAPVLLFVGRLQAEKGVERIQTIFRGVCRSHPHCRLVVVGAMDPVAPVSLAGAEAQPGVILCGPLSDPRPAYAAADLLVLPSDREGLPTVVLEAAAMQVPTVAFDVLGCRDAVLTGQSGTLVPSGDLEAFERAVCGLLADREGRQQLGARARSWATRFERGTVVESLVGQYEAWGIRPPPSYCA